MKFYREDKSYYNYWSKTIRNKLTAIYFSNSVWFFKNGLYHNSKNATYICDGDKEFCLNNIYYGDHNNFTKQSWRRFVKLQVFL